MKSFKIIFNEDLCFKVINTKENNCIDEQLLKDLYKNKCKIDNVDLNNGKNIKNYIMIMNIFIHHLINLKIFLILFLSQDHILKFMKYLKILI